MQPALATTQNFGRGPQASPIAHMVPVQRRPLLAQMPYLVQGRRLVHSTPLSLQPGSVVATNWGSLQTPFSAQYPAPQSPLAVHFFEGGGKVSMPTPSPADIGSLTKVTSASRMAVHFDCVPALSSIEPEMSRRSSRSTGTGFASCSSPAQELPSPSGLGGGASET